MTVRPQDLEKMSRGPGGRNHHEPIEAEDKEGPYGLLAEFTDEEALVEAVRAARAAGYTRMDTFTPYPVEGLPELVAPAVSARNPRDRARLVQAIKSRDWHGVRDWLGKYNLLALLTLAGGIVGGLVGYGLQLWAMGWVYPYLNIGGRPVNSWPYYLPITYELVILFASFTALIGMLLLNGFPRPSHPVFNVPEFARATQDRFFLLIEVADPRFEADKPAAKAQGGAGGAAVRSTRQFLESLAPGRVYDAAL